MSDPTQRLEGETTATIWKVERGVVMGGGSGTVKARTEKTNIGY